MAYPLEEVYRDSLFIICGSWVSGCAGVETESSGRAGVGVARVISGKLIHIAEACSVSNSYVAPLVPVP